MSELQAEWIGMYFLRYLQEEVSYFLLHDPPQSCIQQFAQSVGSRCRRIKVQEREREDIGRQPQWRQSAGMECWIPSYFTSVQCWVYHSCHRTADTGAVSRPLSSERDSLASDQSHFGCSGICDREGSSHITPTSHLMKSAARHIPHLAVNASVHVLISAHSSAIPSLADHLATATTFFKPWMDITTFHCIIRLLCLS